MKRTRMALAGLASGLLLAGCAQALWQKFNDTESARYVGRPVEQMFGEWGAPLAAVGTSTGYYYEFHYFESGIYECRAQVWTDSEKIVSRIAASGQNGCVG